MCEDEGPGSYPDPEREGETVLVQQDERRPGTRSSYWGETGQSLREAQHLETLSEPGKHRSLEYHADKGVEEVKWKLTLVDIFLKAMEREVCEGVVIRCG